MPGEDGFWSDDARNLIEGFPAQLSQVFLTEALEGHVEWTLFLGAPFKRGDANSDGQVNIADAIYILQNFFAEGPAIACPDAADANDDEAVNIADGIYTLQNLFAEGPAIPPPFATCSDDPTPKADPTKPDLTGCIYDQDHCQQ